MTGSIPLDTPTVEPKARSILLKCQCVGKHIPKPMELHKHHVWPIGEGGPDIKANLVLLCPTTHANVHRLWKLYEEYEGRPPWHLINKYSEYARGIVERGREARRRAGGNSNSNKIESGTVHATTILPNRIGEEIGA